MGWQNQKHDDALMMLMPGGRRHARKDDAVLVSDRGYGIPQSPMRAGAAVALLLILATTATITAAMALKFGIRNLFVWPSFALHPMMMTLAFVLLAPLALLSYRGAEDMLGLTHSSAKAMHGVLLGAASVCGVIGAIDMWTVHENGAAAQIQNNWSVHFQSLHSYLGALALASFLLQWLAGFAVFALPESSPDARRAFRPVHILCGVSAVSFSFLAVQTGMLSLAGRDDNTMAVPLLFKSSALLLALLIPAMAVVYSYQR